MAWERLASGQAGDNAAIFPKIFNSSSTLTVVVCFLLYAAVFAFRL